MLLRSVADASYYVGDTSLHSLLAGGVRANRKERAHRGQPASAAAAHVQAVLRPHGAAAAEAEHPRFERLAEAAQGLLVAAISQLSSLQPSHLAPSGVEAFSKIDRCMHITGML